MPVPFRLPEPLAGVTTETFHVFDLSAPPPATLVARLLRVHGHDRPWLAPFIRHGKTLSGPSDHRRTVAEWICGDREAE
ncbi:hypothetical protein [Jannaschia rubra]|uniref:hypothetical protein n=1 Tax=Jannaschia rubra TaxID=282197 RepID=UPI0006E2EE70|nr:hypothetical protein [Jannaschia rubra]